MRISDWRSDVCSSELGRLLELGLGLDHAEDVALLHDEQILAVDLDLGPRPFAEENAVAGFHRRLNEPTGIIARTGTDGDDFAFLRLFLGGVGDDDAARGLLLGFDAADDHRSEAHTSELQSPMGISYAVFCLKKKIDILYNNTNI